MRRAHHDGNHALIVATLEHCGFSVLDLAMVGSGAPDMLVARNGAMMLVEVKNPHGEDRVKQHQRDWHDAWRGPPVVVAHEARDVLDAFDRLMLVRRRSACV